MGRLPKPATPTLLKKFLEASADSRKVLCTSAPSPAASSRPCGLVLLLRLPPHPTRMAPPPPALRPLLLRVGSSQALLLGRPGPGAGRGSGGGARRGWGRDRDGEDVQGRGRGGRRGHARVVDAAAVALRPLEFPDDLVVLVQEALELRQPRRRLRLREGSGSERGQNGVRTGSEG